MPIPITPSLIISLRSHLPDSAYTVVFDKWGLQAVARLAVSTAVVRRVWPERMCVTFLQRALDDMQALVSRDDGLKDERNQAR